MRPARHRADGGEAPAGDDAGVGVDRERAQILHHLLDRDDRRPRREHGLLLDADDAFDEDVAGAVGLLGVDDGHVRPQRRDGGEHLAGVGAGHGADLRVDLGEIGAAVAAQHGEGQPGGTGLVGVRHGGVGVLLGLDGVRPGVLHRVAHPAQEAGAGIAGVGEHQPPDATHADHLVVDHIGRHADQRQVALALTDDLVSGRERDEMGEPFERERLTVRDVLGDGRFEGHVLRHGPPLLARTTVAVPGAPVRRLIFP